MYLFFFFNDTATTEIYTLSLHDALPIFQSKGIGAISWQRSLVTASRNAEEHHERAIHMPYWRRSIPNVKRSTGGDRKSTRLNSSHGYNSYAVFCLKKKKKNTQHGRDARR